MHTHTRSSDIIRTSKVTGYYMYRTNYRFYMTSLTDNHYFFSHKLILFTKSIVKNKNQFIEKCNTPFHLTHCLLLILYLCLSFAYWNFGSNYTESVPVIPAGVLFELMSLDGAVVVLYCTRFNR